jgi:hypothetical protein
MRRRAVAYMLEVLMGAMGDKRRWRTMPWMVTFFGILVVPLGVVSIYFIIIQPIVIGTWCTLCLLAALAMLIMIPFALDELVAMGQFLVWSHRARKSLLRVFLMGGAMTGGQEEKEMDLGSVRSTVTMMMRGVTLPWTLVASAVLGLWLMFTRLIFGTAPPMADSDHLVGALVVTVAIIAMAEVARPLRFVNAMFGLWLIIALWLLPGGSPTAGGAGIAVGLALILLSLPRGARSQDHYASWDGFVVCCRKAIKSLRRRADPCRPTADPAEIFLLAAGCRKCWTLRRIAARIPAVRWGFVGRSLRDRCTIVLQSRYGTDSYPIFVARPSR